MTRLSLYGAIFWKRVTTSYVVSLSRSTVSPPLPLPWHWPQFMQFGKPLLLQRRMSTDEDAARSTSGQFSKLYLCVSCLWNAFKKDWSYNRKTFRWQKFLVNVNPSATPSYMLQIPEFSERTPFSLKARLHNIRVFMGPSEPTLSSQIKGNRSALSPVIQHVAYSRNSLIDQYPR